jgi:acyl-CoA synthetase (AMP-forming)/AMP-acid ligase II
MSPDGEKAAIVTVAPEGERVTTFAELDDHAHRLAHVLTAHGVRDGERVAVMLPNGAEWFEVNLAAARLGAQLVPVNWHLTEHEVGWILADADPKVIVTRRDLAPVATAALDAVPGCAALVVDDGYAEALATASPEPIGRPDAPAPGLVLYTSGTTGRPKGVVHEQTTTARSRSDHVALWGFTDEDVHLLAGPAYHGAPWSFAVTHLALGATVVAMTRWDAARFADAVARYGVTNTFVVPTHLARLLELGDSPDARASLRAQLASLRLVLHGAASCPIALKRDVLALVGDIVWEFYGFSEAGRVTRIGPDEWRAHPGSCGRPLDGVAALILDEAGNELPAGATGTIWVVPAGGRFHYRGNDAATAAVTRSTRLGPAVTGGDVGHLDADGYLFVTDRSVDLVVRGGVNVYPREVEDVLLEHPAVADCAVLGISDEVYGERLLAIVEPVRAAATTIDAVMLTEHCRARLAGFKCPEDYRFVDALPRDPNGKVRKEQLRDAVRAESAAVDPSRRHS